MSRSEITLYNGLRKKLGNQESAELVDFVKSEVESGLKEKTSVFLTKEDKAEMIDRINVTKDDLIDRITKFKTETILWIVGVGIVQFGLTILSKKFL